MARKTLEDLLAEADDLGLLNVKPLAPKAGTDATRVGQQFEEINDFVDKHGFTPGAGPTDRRVSVNERSLLLRLKAYQSSSEIRESLLPMDRHGLLAALPDPPVPDPQTLDEILDLDDDLLTPPGADIFTFNHARPTDAARPDRVSSRKPCPDFDTFKPLFDVCAADLASKTRRSLPFANEMEIAAGEFFILHGITVFVAEVNDPHLRNGKRNARLRLIFENGTEGNNLLRSFARELYKDPNGRRVSAPEACPLFDPEPTTINVAAPRDRITGCIYVVRSLSPLPEIKSLDGNLFKIGFTTGTFEDRIAGAKDDPTFLLAPVHPVRTYDAINLNANRVENLLHRFFADACLDIELMDRFGKPFRPREWFLVPRPLIERAIKMLLDGSIVRHVYNAKSGDILSLPGT